MTALTPAELRVVQRVALGGTCEEIAAGCGCVRSTIKQHRQHAMAKIGVHNTVALTHYCLATGIVDNLYDAQGSLAAKTEAA